MCMAYLGYVQCTMACILEGPSILCCLVRKNPGKTPLRCLMDLGGPLVDLLVLGVETMVGVEDSWRVALYEGEGPRGVVLPG